VKKRRYWGRKDNKGTKERVEMRRKVHGLGKIRKTIRPTDKEDVFPKRFFCRQN